MTTPPIQPPPPTSIEAARAASAQHVRDATRGPERAPRGDSVVLSQRALDLQRFRAAAASGSPEPSDRLAALRAGVRAGSYRVDPATVARALIEHGGL